MSDLTAHPRSEAAATRQWVKRLERFAAGKHAVAAFCAAEGVSRPTSTCGGDASPHPRRCLLRPD